MGKIEMSNAALEPDEDILSNPKRYAIAQFKNRPLSKKQQKFVQLYVYHDLPNYECAHRAGYKHPQEVSTQLLNSPKFRYVQDRIHELQHIQQQKYEITFEKVARDLQTIRDAALEDGSYGPAVQAELGRAKLAGLMVERKEVKYGSISQMDRSEVESRLRELIDSNQLAPVLEARVKRIELEDIDDIDDIEDVEDAELVEED